MNNKVIALTSGDPSSVATFITLKSWLNLKNTNNFFFLISNKNYVDKIINYFNLNIKTKTVSNINEVPLVFSNYLPILETYMSSEIQNNIKLGDANFNNSSFAINSLNKALELVNTNEIKAIVTNPISKDLVNQYLQSLSIKNKNFTGHTEYLSEKTNGKKPIMMLCTNESNLRVVPITVHLSLANMLASLTTQNIVETAEIVNKHLLTMFKIKNPKLLITGLNPHSGENGTMGIEEQTIIDPAIKILKQNNINVDGPIASDTAFSEHNIKNYDCVLGMYHDQVLTPFKTLHFETGVNVTLGLDFIRTSVDHGTAFNIAHTNSASSKSLEAAIIMANNLLSTI